MELDVSENTYSRLLFFGGRFWPVK